MEYRLRIWDDEGDLSAEWDGFGNISAVERQLAWVRSQDAVYNYGAEATYAIYRRRTDGANRWVEVTTGILVESSAVVESPRPSQVTEPVFASRQRDGFKQFVLLGQ